MHERFVKLESYKEYNLFL